ncbi:MAG TPA: hypothetical protein DCR87_03320 [Acidobacteria bacterium]|nr:hypothetical protein [Acidobacteriota bacterium]
MLIGPGFNGLHKISSTERGIVKDNESECQGLSLEQLYYPVPEPQFSAGPLQDTENGDCANLLIYQSGQQRLRPIIVQQNLLGIFLARADNLFALSSARSFWLRLADHKKEGLSGLASWLQS